MCCGAGSVCTELAALARSREQALLPVTVRSQFTEPPSARVASTSEIMEIDFHGARVRLHGPIDAQRLGVVLDALMQTALVANPHSGPVFVFRGRRSDIINVLWSDGQGLLLLAKRLEK